MKSRLRRWMERLKAQEGVTLIELLAVVVILAIIAAVAVPVVMGQITNAKNNTDLQNEKLIEDAMQRAEFDYQSKTSGTLYLELTTNASPKTIDKAWVKGTGITPVSQTQLAPFLTSGVSETGNSSYLDSVPTPEIGGSQFQIEFLLPADTAPTHKEQVHFQFPVEYTDSTGTVQDQIETVYIFRNDS